MQTQRTVQRTLPAFALIALASFSVDVFAQARVLVVHAAPFADSIDGTSVTVTANGAAVESDFTFGSFTDYLTIPAGEYDLAVTPTGADEAAISATVTLEDGVDYTVLAVGDGVNQPLALWPLVDTVSAPADGNLNLRVVHAAPFAAMSTATEVSIRTAGGMVVNGLTGVPYFAESGFFEVPAGNYDLKVASNDGSTNLIDPVAADLPAGANVTIVALGDGNNQPLGILALPVGLLDVRQVVDNSVSGWWQSLNTGREGFILQPIPSENRLVGTIYSWDPEGSGDPRWFTFDGPFADREAVVEVQAFSGGQFGGENDIDPTVAGTVAFEFIDCDTAVAALALIDGTEFTWDLGRLTQTLPCNLD
ncbi:MAG: DUF4397 domain-containing protein [Wenzhouxiangella sp.]|jgi:hypothetical protein|nr:DUF4397 domain-containing protein [Wenzhouxiangella sp.]